MKLGSLPTMLALGLVACGGGSEVVVNEHHRAPDEQSGEQSGEQTGGSPANPQMHAVQSPVSYAETVSRVHRELQRHGVTIVAAIDHAEEGAQSEGLATRPTTLFIFRVGETSELLDDSPTMALDLPQRILVYTTGRSEVYVVWRPPTTLADEHDAHEHERVMEIERLIEQIAAAATAPPESAGTLP